MCLQIPIVSQNQSEDRQSFSTSAAYWAIHNSWDTNSICACTSPFPTPLTWPMRFMFIASTPRKVCRAVLKETNPIPGSISCFINRVVINMYCSRLGWVAKICWEQKTPWERNWLVSYSKDSSYKFEPFSDGPFVYTFNLSLPHHVHNFVAF